MPNCRYITAFMVLALLAGHAGATPFLSVDFNTNASATESPGFVAFTGGNGAQSLPSPVSTTFTVSTPAVTSNAVKIWVNGSATLNASGDFATSTNLVAFNSRTALADSGAFTYADLYRDFVYTNTSTLPTYFEFSGLNAATTYVLTFYAADPNSAKTTTITDITGGGSTLFGSISSTTSFTSNDQYTISNTATSDADGRLFFRVSATTYATVNAVRIDVPEPTTIAFLSLLVPAMLMRRRGR